MDEIWKPVVGHDFYAISNHGRVWSFFIDRPLRPGIASNGYPTVSLQGKTRTVHSLVADAFIGLRPKGMEVRHLDGNCKNPRLDNLEYSTPSENLKDRYRHGTWTVEQQKEVGRRISIRHKEINGPDAHKISNRKGTATKDARYGRKWVNLTAAGIKYAGEYDL